MTVLISKVAIKSTETVDYDDISPEKIIRAISSQKYDSIHVNEKNHPSGHPFKSNYILLKEDQVLPCYLAQIKASDSPYGLCEVCKTVPAKVYCRNDDLDMCSGCDAEHHPTFNKVTSKHIRVDISEKEVQPDLCKTHPESRLESFCLDCRQALCVNCQLTGFHSEPAFKNHKLVPTKQCYGFLKENRKNQSPMMAKIKQKLTYYLSAVGCS